MSTGVVTSMVTKMVPKTAYFNVILFAGGQLHLDVNERHDRHKKMRKQSPSLHPSQSLHPKVQHQSQELWVMVGGINF